MDNFPKENWDVREAYGVSVVENQQISIKLAKCKGKKENLSSLPHIVFPSRCRVSCSAMSDSGTPWTVALLCLFFRQEYWSGLTIPSPGDFPNLRIEPGSPALQADVFHLITREAYLLHNQHLFFFCRKHRFNVDICDFLDSNQISNWCHCFKKAWVMEYIQITVNPCTIGEPWLSALMKRSYQYHVICEE